VQMNRYVQYHNVENEGLPLSSPPFSATRLGIRTRRPNVKEARGRGYLVAGIGRPRRYYLWETFEIEEVKATNGGWFRAFGTGWQLAPPQELTGKPFKRFKAACANFVGFRCINGLPFTPTLERLARDHRPPGNAAGIVAVLRTIMNLFPDGDRNRHAVREALGHYEPVRALSICQPHAEAIIRGLKKVEYRSGPTRIRGRVFVYASQGQYPAEEEAGWMKHYGIEDVASDALPSVPGQK
jgi:ASCH domain